IIIAVLLVLPTAPAAAQEPPRRLPQLDRPPVLDDYATDPGARHAEPGAAHLVLDEFRQRDPHDGEPASEATRAFVASDRDNLYVAFGCREREPYRLRAR